MWRPEHILQEISLMSKSEKQLVSETDSPPPEAKYVPHVVIVQLPTLIQETAGVEYIRVRIPLWIVSDGPVRPRVNTRGHNSLMGECKSVPDIAHYRRSYRR